MKTHDLAKLFADRYHSATEGNIVVSIHLFGIEYSDELTERNLKEICELAEVPVSYQTELRKGMRLAQYVEVRK